MQKTEEESYGLTPSISFVPADPFPLWCDAALFYFVRCFSSYFLVSGTHAVTEMLNELRRMGLVKFISINGRGNKRSIEMINKGE